jgi:hypothetical protein
MTDILIGMHTTTTFQFTRPQYFESGKVYLYREREVDGNRGAPSIVKFVTYDPCPAILIIRDFVGRSSRCLRDDLFELKEDQHQQSSMQLSSTFRRLTNKLEYSGRYPNCSI